MFCTFYICYVHLDLETLNTIRKKINFLLTGQTKTNVYFVTFICTLTARNDIFQRVFVVPQRAFLPARAKCTSSSAPPETRTFFEKSHPIRPPVPAQPVSVSALKNPHPPVCRYVAPRDLRGKTCEPHSSAVETVQFLSKNCADNSVLFKELCRQFSSFQRTVKTVQFFSKNCEDSSVLIKELWAQF